MKILFLSNEFPNSLQPEKSTFNCSMIQSLAELHQTHVISPVSWIDELSNLVKNKTRLNRKWTPIDQSDSLRIEYPRFYYPPKIYRQHYDRFLNYSISKVLNKAITQFQPDIIFSYWLHPDGQVAVKTAREHGIPAVVMSGGSDVLMLTRNHNRKRAIKKVLNQADGIITVSNDIMQTVKDLGIPPEKIKTVYRGVDRCLFSPGNQQEARQRLGIPQDRKIIVSIGRLEPVKGHPVLLDACQKISKQNTPFTCYVLGNGSLKTKLMNKTKEYGLEEFFQLKGPQQQSRLVDWYRAADVIALPSHSEGIPNVLLEAISCGRNFIASHVGGIQEIADPNCDQLVAPDNPDALAKGLVKMFEEPLQIEKRMFEPKSWKESAVQLSQILSDCSTQFTSRLTASQIRQSGSQKTPVKANR